MRPRHDAGHRAVAMRVATVGDFAANGLREIVVEALYDDDAREAALRRRRHASRTPSDDGRSFEFDFVDTRPGPATATTITTTATRTGSTRDVAESAADVATSPELVVPGGRDAAARQPGMQTIDGVTVFPDHADPSSSGTCRRPSLARRGARERRRSFTFIKYKPAAAAAASRAAASSMFERRARADRGRRARDHGRKLTRAALGSPRCRSTRAPSSASRSTSRAPGGTVAPAGERRHRLHAVEQILGASVPSLHGDNNAVFSLALEPGGRDDPRAGVRAGHAPVGVIYDLKFTALRPALDVEITADFERIYKPVRRRRSTPRSTSVAGRASTRASRSSSRTGRSRSRSSTSRATPTTRPSRRSGRSSSSRRTS